MQCSANDYGIIMAATITAKQLVTGLHDKALCADITIDAIDPGTAQAYINSVAEEEIPEDIEFRRLHCEHYYREVNLFVLAMLGLTTLNNIAQLGAEAASLTDNLQEQQGHTASILLTLVILLAVSMMTCNSVHMRLQYAFYTAVAQMWQWIAHILSILAQQESAPMESIMKVQ